MAQELLLNPLHRQAGATLGVWRDWNVPVHFGDPLREYRAIRQQASLIDWSTKGLIEVRGADRVGFLHNMLTHDIKALTPGSGCHAALVTPTAKLLAEAFVLADADAHWMLIDRSRAEIVRTTLEHYLISEDVTLQDRMGQHAVLALQGPRSLAVFEQVLHRPLPPQKPFDHVEVMLDEVPIRLIHASITGELGVILVVIAEQAAWFWQKLMESGMPAGLLPVGWEAMNVARIEAGIPWYGVDMDQMNLLPETGLEERAVNYTKGCYVGQEIIARLQTYGSLSQKLMGLACEGSLAPDANEAILKDGQPVGKITSACVSPALSKPIAMGYVKRPFYEPGTRLEILHEGHRLLATVVKLPFVKSTVHPGPPVEC